MNIEITICSRAARQNGTYFADLSPDLVRIFPPIPWHNSPKTNHMKNNNKLFLRPQKTIKIHRVYRVRHVCPQMLPLRSHAHSCDDFRKSKNMKISHRSHTYAGSSACSLIVLPSTTWHFFLQAQKGAKRCQKVPKGAKRCQKVPKGATHAP